MRGGVARGKCGEAGWTDCYGDLHSCWKDSMTKIHVLRAKVINLWLFTETSQFGPGPSWIKIA